MTTNTLKGLALGIVGTLVLAACGGKATSTASPQDAGATTRWCSLFQAVSAKGTALFSAPPTDPVRGRAATDDLKSVAETALAAAPAAIKPDMSTSTRTTEKLLAAYAAANYSGAVLIQPQSVLSPADVAASNNAGARLADFSKRNC